MLDSIDWNQDDERRHLSNIRLLKESAVRFARWTAHVETYDCDRIGPFYDITEALRRSVSNVPHDVPETAVYLAKQTIPWMLKWYSLLDSGYDRLPEPDPFEPLLLCYHRGGRPHIHHGFLHIEHSMSFNIAYGENAWPTGFARVEPVAICVAQLEEWDAEYLLRLNSEGS